MDSAEVKLNFQPGGIVLFTRNLDSDPWIGPARCHVLIQELQARWGRELRLAVAIDQEGGAVSRLRVWTGPTPSLNRIWNQYGVNGCREWGILWGRGLRLLGINVDFAPVADLHDGHEGTGLGSRAASSNPFEVTAAAGAFLAGMESQGVRGCLKHFPGLGGTQVDSHKALPVIDDPGRILQNLKPFQALAHEDRLVMVGHLKTPFTEGVPTSLHRGSVVDNPWGVHARFIPDDMEMGGCAADSWEDRVRKCLEAGHQALLVCQTPEGIQGCAEAAGQVSERLWKPALEAFRSLRSNLRDDTTQAFDSAAWATWIQDIQSVSADLQES
jgi:beta-N-acetylhexosaminidase